MFLREPSESPMASMDGDGDRDGGGDPLLLGADLVAASGPSDGEQDCTEAGHGEQTTGVGGVSVVVEGDGESNGSLGDDVWYRNGNTNLPRWDISTAFTDNNLGCAIVGIY